MNNDTLTLSPAELSPSRSGLRLWARMALQAYWRKRGKESPKCNAFDSSVAPYPTTFPPQNASEGLKTAQGMASGEPEPIYPVTNQQLSVTDGVVWEGGKKVLSTRARMQRLKI